MDLDIHTENAKRGSTLGCGFDSPTSRFSPEFQAERVAFGDEYQQSLTGGPHARFRLRNSSLITDPDPSRVRMSKQLPIRADTVRRSPLLYGLLTLLLMTGLVVTGFGPPAYIESRAAHAPLNQHLVKQIQYLAPPETRARAAITMDDATEQVLYEKLPDVPRPPASMTKIMTALQALEYGNLDEVVTSTVDAADLPGSSLMGLRRGERLTLRQLLYGLLIPSGNDAALAIAIHLAGDPIKFAQMMNAHFDRLGLENSNFVNPHGLDAAGHFSTPRDIVMIAREAMKYAIFAEIVRTKEIELQTVPPRHLVTTNKLLSVMPDAIGIKTGTTDKAGHNLVSAVDRDGHRVYTVVMNTTDVVTDSQAIYNYVFAKYAWPMTEAPVSVIWRPFVSQIRELLIDVDGQVIVPAWQRNLVRVEPKLSDDPDGTRLIGVGVYLGDELLYWRSSADE